MCITSTQQIQPIIVKVNKVPSSVLSKGEGGEEWPEDDRTANIPSEHYSLVGSRYTYTHTNIHLKEKIRKSVTKRGIRSIYSGSSNCFILTWGGSKDFPKKRKLELMTLLDITHLFL